MVSAFKDGVADALYMYVRKRLRIVDSYAAVCAAEEVVAAFVGEFDFAVLEDDGRVGRQEDGTVKQPPCGQPSTQRASRRP